MKATAIFKKNVLESIRTYKELLVVIALPVVFIAIFGVVFGGTFSNSAVSIDIFVDQEFTSNNQEFVSNFETDLKKATYEDKGKDKPLFKYNIKYSLNDIDYSMNQVKRDELDGVLVISSYSDIEATGDQSNPKFGTFVSTTEGILQQSTPIVKTTEIAPDQLTNTFDFLAPGLIIYGILILIPQITTQVVREVETKRIARLIPTRMSSLDLFTGVFLFELLFGALQVLLLFVTAYLFGFEAVGSIALGFGVALLTLFFAVGVGLLIAAFTKTERVANSIGIMTSIILGFLSGSFLQLPDAKIGEVFGKTRELWEILPSFHATEALQQVLIFNKSLGDVWQNLAYLVIGGIFVFVLGVFFFSKKQLKAVQE